MKEFDKWWKKYTSDGICDYEECYEAGWKEALKWILNNRNRRGDDYQYFVFDDIKKELEIE